MSADHTAKSPGGAGPYADNQKQPADSTADATEKIAVTGRAILSLDSARREKELATLVALFALAGHVVIRGRAGDFTVTRWGMTRYCQGADEMAAFAKRLGVAS